MFSSAEHKSTADANGDNVGNKHPATSPCWGDREEELKNLCIFTSSHRLISASSGNE